MFFLWAAIQRRLLRGFFCGDARINDITTLVNPATRTVVDRGIVAVGHLPRMASRDPRSDRDRVRHLPYTKPA